MGLVALAGGCTVGLDFDTSQLPYPDAATDRGTTNDSRVGNDSMTSCGGSTCSGSTPFCCLGRFCRECCSNSDCGSGRFCGLNGVCYQSSGCSSGQTRCGSSCVDPQTNSDHCGSCGNECRNGARCCRGTCMMGQCQ